MNEKLNIIIQKLKEIDCPHLTDKTDLWIKEVLLTQKSERDTLIEWIFTRLGLSIKGWSEDLSRDNRLEALLLTASSLGLCPKDQLDVIQGTAKQVQQIKFWQLLVDIVWKKITLAENKQELCSVTYNDCSEVVLDQYQQDCSYVSNICSSVDLLSLFSSKVHLFPNEILKDEEISKECITSDQIIALSENNTCDTFPNLNAKMKTSLDPTDITLLDTTNIEQITENELESQFSILQSHITTEFDDTYNQLKPYITNVSEKAGIDVGPAFESVAVELHNFIQAKDAIEVLTDFESDVKSLDLSLNHLQPPDLSLLTELRENTNIR